MKLSSDFRIHVGTTVSEKFFAPMSKAREDLISSI